MSEPYRIAPTFALGVFFSRGSTMVRMGGAALTADLRRLERSRVEHPLVVRERSSR
jgi:hypothetical protein